MTGVPKPGCREGRAIKILCLEGVIIKQLQGGLRTIGNISLPNGVTMYLNLETDELTKSVEALLIPHS